MLIGPVATRLFCHKPRQLPIGNAVAAGWLSSSHALTRPGAVGLQFEVPDENARLHLADELATGVVGAGHAFGVLEVVDGDESIFQILERHVKKRIKTVFLKTDQEGDIRRDRVAALAAGRGV